MKSVMPLKVKPGRQSVEKELLYLLQAIGNILLFEETSHSQYDQAQATEHNF